MAQAKKREIVEGRKAPAFRLQDQDEAWVTSKDLAGAPYVLYFYPKASTPGCTTETCDFRDALPDLEDLGVRVLGASPDAPTRQKKFAEKHGIEFPLLCDTEQKLAEAYGVWQEKMLYGKTFLGIVRSTFLVDADGKVARLWRKVKVKGHVDEVREAAEELA